MRTASHKAGHGQNYILCLVYVPDLCGASFCKYLELVTDMPSRKGSPNNATLYLRELSRRMGADPAKILMDTILKSDNEDKILDAAKTMMPYCYPKLSNVEVQMEAEVHHEIGIEPEAIKIIENIRRVKK